MANITDHSNLSLEKYFSQGLSGITKQNAKVDDFKAFKQDAFLNNPTVERNTKNTVETLLQNNVLDNYVLDNLQQQLIHNDSLSTTEYGSLVHTLSESLMTEAKLHNKDSQEYKILGAASRLARDLEKGREQYKEGRDALLPA